MGCKDAVKDAFDDVTDVTKKIVDPFDFRGDVKEGWDDMRGATQQKEMEKQAAAAKAASQLAESYDRGREKTPMIRGKKAAGSFGQRGSRLVRQSLGSYGE